MTIQHKDNGQKGAFFIEESGAVLAEMTYVWSGTEIMIVDHTEVDKSLQGKSIGKQLVHKAVEMARERRLKILPLCPFAKAVFDRVPDYGDVLFR